MCHCVSFLYPCEMTVVLWDFGIYMNTALCVCEYVCVCTASTVYAYTEPHTGL